MTILPNIVEVAIKHNLHIKKETIGKKEVLCKCPFCLEDQKPHKIKKKWYLSLNEDKNVFKCWFCGEKGGVVRFISLLDGIPENEIIEKLRKENGFHYQKHPAERLSRTQLKMIGYPNINWVKNREFDVEFYKKFREEVWQRWLDFIEDKKDEAYREIFAGILLGNYQKSIKRVKKMEAELGANLLKDVLKRLSKEERNEKELQMEKFICEICKKEHPFEVLKI